MNYITKTSAINDYFLSNDDLSKLNGIEKCNPFRRSDTMTLYLKDDIYEYLKTKYDTNFKEYVEEKLEELRKEKELRKKSRQLSIQNKKDKRKYELTNELQKHGLELRNDSKLCQGFIDGSIKDKKIKWIVNRMCQVKYLYDYCNMDNRLQEFKNKYCYFSFYETEKIILTEINGYPTTFPWLQ